MSSLFVKVCIENFDLSSHFQRTESQRPYTRRPILALDQDEPDGEIDHLNTYTYDESGNLLTYEYDYETNGTIEELDTYECECI